MSKKGIIAGFEPAEEILKAIIAGIEAWEAFNGSFKKYKSIVPETPAEALFTAKNAKAANQYFLISFNI